MRIYIPTFKPAFTEGSHHYQLLPQLLLVASLLALGACSSRNDSPGDGTGPGTGNPPLGGENGTGQLAFVATTPVTFDSSRIDRISLDSNTVTGSYPTTGSDIVVDSDGTNVYQLGRFGLDSITRYDPLDTSLPDYQISVAENNESANPYDIAFVDNTKAYLTRYDSNKVWIIDPEPESDDRFKLGELDLGAYDTDAPNMTDAIIVDDKLFVLMERLNESYVPDKRAYLAVFDTRTDTEIQTGQGINNLKGIALMVTNPTALQYNADTNEIYVIGRGNFFESSLVSDDFHSGGIEVVDAGNYIHSLLIDDGTDDDNQGYFVDAVVVSPRLGYLLTYTGYDPTTIRSVTTLRTFNPTTGLLAEEAVPGYSDLDISTLALGPNGKLWVGINDSTPGFDLIDTASGTVTGERIRTEFVPRSVVFVTVDDS